MPDMEDHAVHEGDVEAAELAVGISAVVSGSGRPGGAATADDWGKEDRSTAYLSILAPFEIASVWARRFSSSI